MILNIIKNGDNNFNLLLNINNKIKKSDIFIYKLISDMFETLDTTDGVGLAAPQVGMNYNLFIIKYQEFKEVFINPKIHLEGHNLEVREGCLSFPDKEYLVNRRNKVTVEYFDKNWKHKVRIFEGIMAIIIQHEYDHLIGKLINENVESRD